MKSLTRCDQTLSEPDDYFQGVGKGSIPTPENILLFQRKTRQDLQQSSLQNRSHHRYVLLFNLQTEGRVHLDSLSILLKPGDALCILPYQFHHFSHLSSSRIQWLFCTFDLEPQSWLEPFRNRAVHVGTRTQAALQDLLEEWTAPHRELQPEQLQVGLMKVLISLKQDRRKTGTDSPLEGENNLVRTINQLLAEWRGRPVVTPDLARELKLSDSYLRRRFKEAAGIPLGRYLQNYRMNQAMALLRTTTFPIAQVAEEAGFGSPQAFSRIFKKETGKTPRSYRMRGKER